VLISMDDVVSVQPLEFYRPKRTIFTVAENGKAIRRLIPERMFERKPKLRKKIGGQKGESSN
jgi:hypothetical protein